MPQFHFVNSDSAASLLAGRGFLLPHPWNRPSRRVGRRRPPTPTNLVGQRRREFPRAPTVDVRDPRRPGRFPQRTAVAQAQQCLRRTAATHVRKSVGEHEAGEGEEGHELPRI